MTRLEDLARTYWVDALIALLAIAGALELVVARNSESDPATSLWLSVLLLFALVAPIFARRRFPFGGPAAYWVLAAAITVAPMSLPTSTAARPTPPAAPWTRRTSPASRRPRWSP